MSKRYTDTEIWLEDWFVNFSDAEMLFWYYIKDQCDHAGFWRPNFKVFETLCGRRINQMEFLTKINTGKERIKVLENGRWFITSFIVYQYGERLNLNNHRHKAIYETFRKNLTEENTTIYGFEVTTEKQPVQPPIIQPIRQPPRPLLERNIIPPTFDMVKRYCDERRNGIDPQSFIDHYTARDWIPKGYNRRMSDWQAAIRTWEKNRLNHSSYHETQEDLFDRLEREGKIPRRPL